MSNAAYKNFEFDNKIFLIRQLHVRLLNNIYIMWLIPELIHVIFIGWRSFLPLLLPTMINHSLIFTVKKIIYFNAENSEFEFLFLAKNDLK
jgi:hypothetical protein